jgi:pimeloyl-ACP methyl ester carboxylesterase
MATATHILEPRIVTVGGYRLHMLEGGQGPAVLLLHGFAGSSEDWRATAEFLIEQGYRALAVDCLGFGRSEKPGDAPYSLQLIADLYAELLDTLAIEQATVVAHSMGGKYALTLALQHPARIDRLVLVGSDGFVEPSRLTRAGGVPLLGPGILWLSAQPQFTRAMLNATFYEPERYVDAAAIERARTALLGPDNRRALIALSRRAAETDLTLTGLRARLGELRQPVLLIWGEQDQVFPPARGETAQAEIPDAHLVVIPRCGHFPQVEAAAKFRGLLLSFLAR